MLVTGGNDGVNHPVSYFPREFYHHQWAYSTIEKKELGLIPVLKQFEVYVGSGDAPAVVNTEHNPLVFIHPMRNTNQRLMCWVISLQASM